MIDKILGLGHKTRSLMAYADSECPDQTAHLRSLIRAFVVRLYILKYHKILSVDYKFSVCPDVQADLGLHCPHMHFGPFSSGESYLH